MKTPAQLMESALDKLEYAQDCIGGAKAQIKLALERQPQFIDAEVSGRLVAATMRVDDPARVFPGLAAPTVFGLDALGLDSYVERKKAAAVAATCRCVHKPKDAYAAGPHHHMLLCDKWAPEFIAPGAETPAVDEVHDVPTGPGEGSAISRCDVEGHDWERVGPKIMASLIAMGAGTVSLTCRNCDAEELLQFGRLPAPTAAGVR